MRWSSVLRMLVLVTLTLLLLLTPEHSEADYITAYTIPLCHHNQREDSLLGEHQCSCLLVILKCLFQGRLINYMRRRTLGTRKKGFLLGLSRKYMKKSPLRFGKWLSMIWRNAGASVVMFWLDWLAKPFDYKKLTEAENSNCSNLYFVMVYNGI